MPLSREDIAEAYRLVLGRPPEDELVIDYTLQKANDPWMLVRGLLGSGEYRSRLDPYQVLADGDLELLQRHAVASEPQAGFVTDFLGTRTDIRFSSYLGHLGGLVEGLPVPASLHAEAIEWIGALRAVEEAGDAFNVAEIGAGWGPWLVAAGTAAQRLGKTVFMAGVEAVQGHFESMQAHLRNNGFDPQDHALIQGAVGPVDGFAFFPRVEAGDDWGAAAIFYVSGEPPAHDYRGYPQTFDRMPAISMRTALAGRDVFDLAHIDVQGSERELIPSALGTLNSKVRRMVLGTHSRAIEGEMIELLSADWVLEYEKPCRFKPAPGRNGPKETKIDGVQVWRNARDELARPGAVG